MKNGLDCQKENALTCKQDLYAQHLKWLRNADAKFMDSDNLDTNPKQYEIEVSPLVSYNGEGLNNLLKEGDGKLLSNKMLIEMDTSNNNVIFTHL